jgi:aryl-alcohol dehydrogenase-like predicted oxidoreductase
MEKVNLGRTEERISCMGLGTMYFGTKVNEQSSFHILDCYCEKGGSFLDTANKYASWVPGFTGGESELLLGKWMKQRLNRKNMFIATKVGFPYGGIPRSLKKETIVSECEKSLSRLGIETIDLYFAHAFDDNTPAEEVMEAFSQLRKQGKIRFAGASNFYGWQIYEADQVASLQGWEGFVSLQQRFSYFEPGLGAKFGQQVLLTPEIQELCARKNITIMVYSPLLGGLYTKHDQSLPPEYDSAINKFRRSRLLAIAQELNISANAVVLAWMIQHSPAMVPVMGVSSSAQLMENMGATCINLSDDQIKQLNGSWE